MLYLTIVFEKLLYLEVWCQYKLLKYKLIGVFIVVFMWRFIVQKLIILGGLVVVLLGCSPKPNIESEQPVKVAEVQSVPTDSADWVLKDADIVFSSTKTDTQGNDITESGNLTQYSALFNKQGQLRLEINLNGVDTGIVIRDQRIKDWLFEVDNFATAIITAQLDGEQINRLALNQSIQLSQPITLDLHGIKTTMTANLLVTRIQPNALLVKTTEPIFIKIDDFGLMDGLKKLTDVMMLAKIGSDIPVTFSGEFHRPL